MYLRPAVSTKLEPCLRKEDAVCCVRNIVVKPHHTASADYIGPHTLQIRRMRSHSYQVYMRTIAFSIVISYVVFIVFTYYLVEWDIHDSDFFHVDVHNATLRPRLLDMEITSNSQLTWISAFFFFNQFAAEWNAVVIDSIFTNMECGSKCTNTFQGQRGLLFALFTVYDIWCGVRRFFGILGMTSNYVFLLATIGGGLTASLLTKLMYMFDAEYALKTGYPDLAKYIKEEEEIKPKARVLGERRGRLRYARLRTNYSSRPCGI